MSSVQFIGRQPIINQDGVIIAYELFYESESLQHNKSIQTSTLISSVINAFGIKNILGDSLGFVKIDETFLMGSTIYSVPKNLFVFSLVHTITVNTETYTRIKELKEMGYTFALHDISYKTTSSIKRFHSVIPFLSYIKIDFNSLPQEYLAKLKEIFSPYAIRLIATNINTHEEHAIAQSLAYTYMQGYYFSEPVIIEHKSIDPKALAVIEIYNMLKSDTSIEELTAKFEMNHELTIQLLQYINSSAFFLKQQVSSIQQVLTLLGRAPLSQWLLLLLYGKSINHSATQSALMQMVSRRATLMKGLYRLLYPNATQVDEGKAFFVGVMSLSSTVMSVPLRLILKELNLSVDVTDALLEKSGILGELLNIVKAIENFDTGSIRGFIKQHNLATVPFLKLMSDTALT